MSEHEEVDETSWAAARMHVLKSLEERKAGEDAVNGRVTRITGELHNKIDDNERAAIERDRVQDEKITKLMIKLAVLSAAASAGGFGLSHLASKLMGGG